MKTQVQHIKIIILCEYINFYFNFTPFVCFSKLCSAFFALQEAKKVKMVKDENRKKLLFAVISYYFKLPMPGLVLYWLRSEKWWWKWNLYKESCMFYCFVLFLLFLYQNFSYKTVKYFFYSQPASVVGYKTSIPI